MKVPGWVVLRTECHRTEADAIVALLGLEGIEAVVSSDDAGGTVPSMEEGLGVQVLVRTEEAERADTILREQEQAARDSEGEEA